MGPVLHGLRFRHGLEEDPRTRPRGSLDEVVVLVLLFDLVTKHVLPKRSYPMRIGTVDD
jgi:hypothetical protein